MPTGKKAGQVVQKCLKINNWSMNYINLSLENFKGINSTNLIVITFLVLILQTYKYQENEITGLDSCYVLLIYAAKTPGLFH